MKEVYLSLICSLAIAIAAIPTIIRISYLKHLYDVPDDRKVHGKAIPTLGGLAIFAGFAISMSIFAPSEVNFIASEVKFIKYQYLYAALLIIFFTGIQDDILSISPLKKLLGQIIAAALVVLMGGVKLTSMHGLFGIQEIQESWSIALTIFTLLVVMNGSNLIDGINWLSGGVGIVVSLAFGAFFLINGRHELAIISSSLIGGIIGFMWFNRTPAKIFMGDTGSLIIGLINGVLCIYFININGTAAPLTFEASPIVAFGILIIPLFDTLRVFLWRMLRGKSPFSPDRNHIHHRLLELGHSHMKSSAIIVLTNIAFITFLYFAHDKINSFILLLILLGSAATLSYLPSMILKRRKNEGQDVPVKNTRTKRPPLSKVS
ncbi:MAG: UDP-GlcNAc:undecaprenyl-phosphate GlcNAc-1-phosphate transferase [Glaciecola sp.]|jgi:UDP-GlcNAc:undecaprenyl-phosphate GlcNAc-1-phosphate transferase